MKGSSRRDRREARAVMLGRAEGDVEHLLAPQMMADDSSSLMPTPPCNCTACCRT